MAQEKTAEIVIRYDGETADSGRLKLFEASESLEGTTRVVNLVVHAFVNKNEIRERLTAPSGANTYLSSARKGCFEESIEIDFGAEVVSRIKPSVIIPNFWDYFTCCIEVAVGRDYDASMPMVKKIQGRTESFFEEMAEELEAPLQLLHRPIKTRGARTITFARPKSGDVLVLDKHTLDYVSTFDIEVELSNWQGNVTKYNSLTGVGRMFIDEFGGTIPFKIKEFKSNVRAHKAAGASLNEWIEFEQGKRKIVAHAVKNSLGTTKRIVVQEINEFF